MHANLRTSNRNHVVVIVFYGLCEETELDGYYPWRKRNIGRLTTRVEFEGEANGKAREVLEIHGGKVAFDGSFNIGSGETRTSRASLESEALCLCRGIAIGRYVCDLYIPTR